jgi:hypothetical protein
MTQRRSGEVDTHLHEEVAAPAKRDPRRDSLPPGALSILTEMQKELAALKMRVGELEATAASERAKRLEAEESVRRYEEQRREPFEARATRQLRAPSRRPPPTDELASKPTRQLKVPSRRPGPLPKK